MVLAYSAYLGRLTCPAVDEPANVAIDKTLRDTAGKQAFRLEAEAVIALGFVSATLCLLMFLSSFTQQLFCVHLLKVQNPII